MRGERDVGVVSTSTARSTRAAAATEVPVVRVIVQRVLGWLGLLPRRIGARDAP